MKKQHAPKNRKFVLTGVIVLAILTIVGLAIVATVAVQQSRGALNQSKATIMNMQGEAVCLPHKDTSGPQTQECAFGLKTGKDTYYALRNLDAVDGEEPFSVNDSLLVSGTLVPPADNEKYDVAGTVEVYAVKLRN